MDIDRITQELAGCVGGANVSVRPVEVLFNSMDAAPGRLREVMGGDTTGRRYPAWVVWPAAAAEVTRIMKVASSRGLAVVPYGGGTNLTESVLVGDDRPVVVVDLKRMDAVLEVDETSLVAHVQAGILGADLMRIVAARRLGLGHLPTSLSFSTLGGWLATRGAGLAMGRYGRIEDLCLSLSVVLPDGRLIQTRPAPRKATGPDLMHLFLGSEGLLGIVTSARVRLARDPGLRVCLSAEFPTPEHAVEAVGNMILSGLRPAELAVLDPVLSRTIGASEKWCLVCSFEGLVARVEEEEALDAVQSARGRPADRELVARWRRWRWSKPFEDLERRVEMALVDEMDFSVGWDRAGNAARAVQDALTGAGATCLVELGMPSSGGLCLFVAWARDRVSDVDGGARRGQDMVHRGQGPNWMRRFAGERIKLRELAVSAAVEAGAMPFHHRGFGRLRAELVRTKTPGDFWMISQIKRVLDPKGIMNPWLWESVDSDQLEERDAG